MIDRDLTDRVLGLLEEGRQVSAVLAIAEAVERLGRDLKGTLEGTLGLARVQANMVDRVLVLEAKIDADEDPPP